MGRLGYNIGLMIKEIIFIIFRTWKDLFNIYKNLFKIIFIGDIKKNQILNKSGQSNYATLKTVKKAKNCLLTLTPKPNIKPTPRPLPQIHEYEKQLYLYKKLCFKKIKEGNTLVLNLTFSDFKEVPHYAKK